MSFIKISREGPIAVLSLDRPDALNALSPTMLGEMRSATEAVALSDARVMIIRGEGRAFSAGADLKALRDPAFTREVGLQFSQDARRMTYLMETMPQVVISRVQGYCFTGAFEILLASDFIIASDDAVFADTHAKIGRTPSWGLSQRLPRLIGVMKAKEMSLTAQRIPAAKAVAMGLILDAVPIAEVDARVERLASQICDNDPLSIAAYKSLFRHAQTLTLDEGLAYEAATRFPRNRGPVA